MEPTDTVQIERKDLITLLRTAYMASSFVERMIYDDDKYSPKHRTDLSRANIALFDIYLKYRGE